MARYAFVIPVSTGYEQAATAAINSINRHHDDVDIHALNYDLSPGDLPEENVTLVQMPEGRDKAGICRNYRWHYMSTLENYDAACIMDADLFLVRNTSRFFSIAADSGIMVATSDCTNIFYEEKFRKRYPGVFTGDFYNTKTTTAVPMFMSPKRHGKTFELAYEYCGTVRHINDTYAINFAICNTVWNDLLVLPAYAWTGIHHCQLKPETRIRKILGQYVSEAGDEVYMIHGRWFDEKWVKGLRTTMDGYFRNHFQMNNCQVKKFMGWVDASIQTSLEAYRELI